MHNLKCDNPTHCLSKKMGDINHELIFWGRRGIVYEKYFGLFNTSSCWGVEL